MLYNILIRRVLVFWFFVCSTAYADQELISLFPLANYSQEVSQWIKPSDKDFDKPLVSLAIQKKRLEIYYDHYFGANSPWDANYANLILHQPSGNDVKSIEKIIIDHFTNKDKSDNQIGYAENFRPYANEWIEKLAYNINISQFDSMTYNTNNRGIAIDNLHARALPTEDVHFYNYKLAGQGYPFDNLQMSALWIGTPVYIIGETRDHAWSLVLTPDFIAWVKSNGIARADNNFVNTWISAAKNNLAAITRTQTSLIDDKEQFLVSAYVGSVFPAILTSTGIQLMVPVADANHKASISHAIVSTDNAIIMPMIATPHNFANLIRTLIDRPYGWGSMYFYNDCSAELKSLLTPFAIWLPRHSSDQISIGKMVDMSYASPEKRIAYLMESGQRFLTIVYIGGHVLMYIGNYTNPNKEASLMVMTYQNMWGLSPNPPIRRAVVGKSVLFPMLLQYPEDTNLVSLAAKKYFQVSFLNQLPVANTINQSKTINIKSLMYSDTFSQP